MMFSPCLSQTVSAQTGNYVGYGGTLGHYLFSSTTPASGALHGTHAHQFSSRGATSPMSVARVQVRTAFGVFLCQRPCHLERVIYAISARALTFFCEAARNTTTHGTLHSQEGLRSNAFGLVGVITSLSWSWMDSFITSVSELDASFPKMCVLHIRVVYLLTVQNSKFGSG